MITKTIHYCWFGRGELPEKAKQCIESWKKFCPDYEIKEWNEDNFDMNSCAYVKEAYEAKKWALAVIGRKCSTWLYIIHPIFITAFSVATGKLGIKSIYRCVAPIVTYCATLTFLIVMCRLKSLLVKNNQRK